MKAFISFSENNWNITQNACCFLLLQVELLFFPFNLLIATENAFCETEAALFLTAAVEDRQEESNGTMLMETGASIFSHIHLNLNEHQ